MTESPLPLLSFAPGSLPAVPIRGQNTKDYNSDSDDGVPGNPRRWYHHVPLCILVLLLLAPHPSILYVLLNYHYLTLHATHYFIVHLLTIYAFSFLAFCSLIVCVARDPGPVPDVKPEVESSHADDRDDGGGPDGDISLQDALLGTAPPDDDDYTQPGKWCRICWRPKPDRTHHCSKCGRCVLKMGACALEGHPSSHAPPSARGCGCVSMGVGIHRPVSPVSPAYVLTLVFVLADHHCPWMGGKCIGFRTYPSFLHFLASVTLLTTYVTVVCIRGLIFAFSHPLAIDETTPVHMLLLSFAGCAFTLVIGSFLGYHIYLVLTNQTTIEHISPFHILRHLPPLPPSRLSSPPLEHQLAFAQRHAVRVAHARMRLYDVGWRRNAAQVFGMGPRRRSRAWVATLLWGGGCHGTGTQFPRNPLANDVLIELAAELVRLEDSAESD
ncbi:hypothetical protein F5148DRAFT_913259 [Russula earlei]|uniref:Uncharacterized protein n=1 Tax=Russula earlei TaxID=71964 RepID=A0ACC0U9M9_9AGAM|nr:hypothetical protein F5148DRAFT_913259 [Russula earlei]